jgi:hypothetical protein
MLLDTPAIVAVIPREPGSERLRDQIDESAMTAVSAATLLETHLVLTGRLDRARPGAVCKPGQIKNIGNPGQLSEPPLKYSRPTVRIRQPPGR